jgi:GTP-binding protein HflX
MDEKQALLSSLGEQKAVAISAYKTSSQKQECIKQLQELHSLAHTLGIEVCFELPVPLKRVDPATYIGKGKVAEVAALLAESGCGLALFDDEISPQQQKNLEKALGKTVIDRTELILAVFAERARSREARLQIELASHRYQLPRLKRMWTHLSRQRTGGAGGGFLKGEGEKQIEIDRRILRRRITQLEKELVEIKKQRETQRSARKRSQIPTFAIVGYTNVGKSTLLRALTAADVLVEDKLFATLDTTTRKYILPNRQEILLTDTVGFIRKIPHLLVASFKSTLEESIHADILLHVVDVSNPDALMQAETTLSVLKELGASHQPMITLLNKVDACSDRRVIDRLRATYPHTVEISALHRAGFDRLLELMMEEMGKLRSLVALRIPQSHYALVSVLMREGRVVSCEYEGNDVLIEAEVSAPLARRVELFKRPDA